MIRIFILLVLVFCGAEAAHTKDAYAGMYDDSKAVRFFESIQDIPLMPGLYERADATMVFDKPGGRIIESVAEMGALSGQDVRAYYVSALPQFGWQYEGQDRFTRQNESLEIKFEVHDGIQFFHVLVQPR